MLTRCKLASKLAHRTETFHMIGQTYYSHLRCECMSLENWYLSWYCACWDCVTNTLLSYIVQPYFGSDFGSNLCGFWTCCCSDSKYSLNVLFVIAWLGALCSWCLRMRQPHLSESQLQVVWMYGGCKVNTDKYTRQDRHSRKRSSDVHFKHHFGGILPLFVSRK